MKPLIKWSGGKSDEIKHIDKYIPNDYSVYVEPFVGGGSVFFHLEPKKSVISDVHKELIDFYQCMKDGRGSDLFDWMTEHPNDAGTYYKIRDEMVINNSFDSACRFYYQRKTCFRGMMRYNKKGKFNIPFGRYKTISFSDLQDDRYRTVFENCDIVNDGFEYIFKTYNSPEYFCFLDPPYDSEFTDYGYCKFGREQHEKLAECFKNTQMRCMMVIGKTEYISELYKDYIVDEYAKNYKFKIHSGRVGNEINTKHLVIMNFKTSL
jgi:DNA adenine methylase